MYKRIELHNHSTESDGALSIEELVCYAEEHHFEMLAITDHNTCSGWKKAKEVISKNKFQLSILRGIEITTFYGHILVLGLNRMVDFTDLDPRNPDQFFRKLHNAGAKAVGIAHPFCVGSPIMVGCRCDMDIHNCNDLDYIEINNTSSSDSFNGNEKALSLWENLVFQGHRIAAVSGKDLHKIPHNDDVFTTYAIVPEKECFTEDEAIDAILHQKTIVTKGPLFEAIQKNNKLIFYFDNTSEYMNWNRLYSEMKAILEITTDQGDTKAFEINLDQPFIFEIPKKVRIIVSKIYNRACCYEQLMAVGAPIFLKGEEI